MPAPRSSAYSGQLYRPVEAAYNTIACKLAKFSNPKTLAKASSYEDHTVVDM